MIFSFKPEKYRKDFPLLNQNLIYFDNACMSLKPQQVLDKMYEYYTRYTACGGRSSHTLAKEVEAEVAKTRLTVKSFIHAKKEEECVFTRNTTEGINLVANSFGLQKGDEVIISDKEHNSNLIPWLKMQKEKGIKLHITESNLDNTFSLEAFESTFTKNTKLVSVVHVSNMDGVANPIKEIAKITHEHNAALLVDGAQSVPSTEVNVQKLDVDFFSFSGHKMLGPTGTGVLYGKKERLEQLSQFIVGGETVLDATYDSYLPEKIPHRFEAGLQDYAGIIGLSEACKYLENVGMNNIEKHEIKLNKLVTERLAKHVKILGPQNAEKRNSIFSFTVPGKDIHHISGILNSSKNIMIRSGAHCVHSWFNKHNMKGSARASMYFYNTEEEANIFCDAVEKIVKI
jgi:cysteine desulfurase/selenocysteine lyase